MKAARVISLALAFWASTVQAEADDRLSADISAAQVLTDTVLGEDWVRFRLIMPRLDPARADALTYEDIAPLFDHLCRETVLPYLANHGLSPQMVVISLSDRFVVFGDTDTAATQYFDQFRVESGDCIWEEF